MDRRKKIIVVVAVLVVGVALSLEFRKHKTMDSSPSSASTEPSAGSGGIGQTAPIRRPVFDGRIEPSPEKQLGAAAGFSREPASSTQADEQMTDRSAPTNVAPMVDLNAPQQKHQIVDGDTLPKLAQRYLDSADQWPALFEYNRDVLKNPEVLPIGAELRIPPKFILPPVGAGQVDSATPQMPLSNAVHGSGTPISSPPPMVNVPSTPQKISIAPASIQRSTSRTYTVQSGESLMDVARKVYGDGRRYQDLFEANRRQLRTPSDLKPGMVLAVP